MKLTLSPVSICRTPIFSSTEDLESVWHELKNYIQESSPSFFEIIKEMEYSALKSSDPKVRFTIWKYFNRARFRATPYGNFAAFTLVPISKECLAIPIVLLKNPQVHRFANWQEKENISFDPKWLSQHANFLRSNTTFYRCGNELRFVNIDNGSFELSSIDVEKTTLATLNFCATKHTLQEVQGFLQNSFGLSRPITNYFIEQLISLQLLLTDFQPNIIGIDYFTRIDYPSAEKKNDYIIAERMRSAGHLSEKNLHILIELTAFLRKHNLANSNPALNNFRENFTKRFENKEIPLLVAMDPEIGIGYKSLAQDKEEDQLIQDLKINRQEAKTTSQTLNYSPLYQFILNEMIQNKMVQLHEFKDNSNSNNLPVANTLSIMLHFANEFIVIEQIGGSTANSLLGRFSMASEEITKLGNQFAALEHKANPDVLFFDIAYQIEKNADNINRRKSIYNYELPILSWPESEYILDPNDIILSIKGDELILHSVKYGKRLVPKLASAYNYTRSDLSVYRFLSDLQHQKLNSSLGINILDIFPGLSHYQRIQYKHIILSPEKWLVPKSICADANTLPALYLWLDGISLKRPFKCGFADQTLIFNPQIEEDMSSFLLFCKNKTTLYIEEAFIPEVFLVNDETAKPYLSEFIVNLEHTEKLYSPYLVKGTTDRLKHTIDTYLPGDEWLYFEIYCHPSKSNFILSYIAENYLFQHKKKLKKWFFIRYNDPSYHIRLRFKLIDKKDISEFLSSLATLLEPYVTIGIISDMQLKTYHREIVRYGQDRMELVEQCFTINSDLVLYLIKKPHTLHSHYNVSVLLLENVYHAAGYDLQEQLSFTENMANIFAAEMNISSEGFKKINQGYKDFNIDTEGLHATIIQYKKLARTVSCFQNVLKRCLGTEKDSLLSDLFHMHANRLFNDDQRMHEMIIYHYLTKRIKMKIGRHKQKIG